MMAMITRKELDEKQEALRSFVVMTNENDNIEKKRAGVQSIKTELEEECPFVKDYEAYPDFGIVNYIQDFVLYRSHLHEIEGFVDGEYAQIQEYETLDEETKKCYADKLVEYNQATSVHYTNKSDPHPDRIFTRYGSYRRFVSYQNLPIYKVARKMRRDVEEKGEEDFSLHFRAYMLYNAAVNELATIEKTMRRMGYLIAETTIVKRSALPEGDPYADVVPFRNPDADPYIFYNFWGASLKKKQEQYSKKEVLTGDQKATFLAPFNYRKLLLEFVRLFQSARADSVIEVPELTKKELESLLSKLFNDFVERVNQEFGTSFEVLAEKCATWENRTINAAHDAEDRVPTIICLDSESDGEVSSSRIRKFIEDYCRDIIQQRLLQHAFSPRNRDIGVLRYDFWGDDYAGLVEKYKGKRGLPDDLRALFRQEDNSNLFVKKVKGFIDEAIDECAKNGWRVGTREMARTLDKAKTFFQDQFYKYNQHLEDTDLSLEEKNNASLGWIYFARRDVGRVRWEGKTNTFIPAGQPNMRGVYFTFSAMGCGQIFDDMKRRFIEDSSLPTLDPPQIRAGLFEPRGNATLNLDRLYEYLTREEVHVIIVSKSDFEYAVKNADFNQIFKDAETLKKTVRVKCLIQYLKEYFPKNWIEAVSRNCGKSKDSLKKINYERDGLKQFNVCIRSIPIIG